MISDLGNSGSMPVLEQMVRFTAQRQKLIAHNIANMDTPDFRQVDASPASFQSQLRRAVVERRSGGGWSAGSVPLPLRDTKEVRFDTHGDMTLRPGSPSGNVLYHDRNNRDLEGLMQDLAENGMAFRLATDLLQRENNLLRTAISQRV